MKKWICLIMTFVPMIAWSQPTDTLIVQEFRSAIQELGYQVHAQATELRLLEERIMQLEKQGDTSIKMAPLSKKESDVASDLKRLKQHLDQAEQSLRHVEQRLSHLDRKVEQDLAAVQKSLKEMVLLLVPQESATYVVQPGDSLGGIASLKKVSVKQLKEWNQLQTDTIFPGQKLKILAAS